MIVLLVLVFLLLLLVKHLSKLYGSSIHIGNIWCVCVFEFTLIKLIQRILQFFNIFSIMVESIEKDFSLLMSHIYYNISIAYSNSVHMYWIKRLSNEYFNYEMRFCCVFFFITSVTVTR